THREPPIVARLSVTRRVPRSRSPSRLQAAGRCSMRRPLAVFITLCLASTIDAAPVPRKEALVKQAVLLTDPQDMRMTEAMFRAYEEQFTEQELEQLLAFLKGDVGRKFLGVLKEEKKWLVTRAIADPAAELQKSKE